MPKYLFRAAYTAAGAEGIASAGGSSRRDAVAHTLAGVGGKLESFHFGFGDSDAYVIAELPDDEAAVALSLVVNGSGGATVSTTPLLTPEQVDEAAKRSVDYRPPGG